jgi:hypothetical protein
MDRLTQLQDTLDDVNLTSQVTTRLDTPDTNTF